MREAPDTFPAPWAAQTGHLVVLRLCLGIAISAFFMGALLSHVTLEQVADALSRIRGGWLLAALLAIGLSVVLRVQRWAMMLRCFDRDLRFRDAAVPLVGSIALNNLLPLRMGDAVRIIAFQSFTGVVTPRQLGTLLLERLLDVSALLLILLAASLAWPPAGLDSRLILTAQMLAAAGLIGIAALLSVPAAARWLAGRAERLSWSWLPPGRVMLMVYEGIRRLLRPQVLARLAAVTLSAWIAESAAFFAVARALGVPHPAPAALLATSIATIATGIPSLPGYLGTFDFFGALSATAFGAPQGEGVAYAILVHALLWIPVTAVGWRLLQTSHRIGVRRGPPMPR